MCMGGGGSGATITMPDTGAYEQQFDLQRRAIEQQMNNGMQLMQNELQNSLRAKEDLLTQIKDIKKERADSAEALDEQARRMSVLVGAPPPEKAAEAPAIGTADRKVSTTKGKSQLRISRTTAASFGQGAGLNIT